MNNTVMNRSYDILLWNHNPGKGAVRPIERTIRVTAINITTAMEEAHKYAIANHLALGMVVVPSRLTNRNPGIEVIE